MNTGTSSGASGCDNGFVYYVIIFQAFAKHFAYITSSKPHYKPMR